MKVVVVNETNSNVSHCQITELDEEMLSIPQTASEIVDI